METGKAGEGAGFGCKASSSVVGQSNLRSLLGVRGSSEAGIHSTVVSRGSYWHVAVLFFCTAFHDFKLCYMCHLTTEGCRGVMPELCLKEKWSVQVEKRKKLFQGKSVNSLG